MQDLQKFSEYLDQVGLMPRSKNQYMKVIRLFFSEYEDVTKENISGFLIKRDSYYYKYAFKHLLKFLNRYEEYVWVVKIKKKPRVRYGVYTDKEKIKEMLRNIRPQAYQLVGIIQFLTGARAHDVLGFRGREYMKRDNDHIILHLIGKGGKEYPVLIYEPHAKIIEDHIPATPSPFLRGRSTSHTKLVDNNYRYYWKELKRVSKLTGIDNFRSHDFRRNLATDVYKGTKDIFLVKELLGQSNISTTVKYLETISKDEAFRKAKEFRE